MSTSKVVSIVDGLPLRLAKAHLPDASRLPELLFVSTHLSRQRPDEVPGLIQHMRLLAPDTPPFDGLDHPDPVTLTIVPPTPSVRQQRSERAHDWSAAAHRRSVDAAAHSAAAKLRMLNAKHKIAG